MYIFACILLNTNKRYTKNFFLKKMRNKSFFFVTIKMNSYLNYIILRSIERQSKPIICSHLILQILFSLTTILIPLFSLVVSFFCYSSCLSVRFNTPFFFIVLFIFSFISTRVKKKTSKEPRRVSSLSTPPLHPK